MDWPFDPTPEQLEAEKQLRRRAQACLRRLRDRLPKLTRKQSATIVAMLMAAYNAGQADQYLELDHDKRRAMRTKALLGVAARRRASSNPAMVEAVRAAAAKGRPITAKALATRFSVSLPTAYRAIRAARRRRPR